MMNRWTGLAGTLLSLFLLTNCGVPNFEASEAQRAADLEWVFATFDRNYAPLEWKKAHLGVDVGAVKAACLEKNKSIKTNDEFRSLVYWCVNQFQDAHTKAFQMGSLYPGKATVAYLGFKTRRHKDLVKKKIKDEQGNTKEIEEIREAISVSGFLATTDEAASPIKTDDVIIEANGKPIWEVIESEIVPINNLGQAESNRTVAASYFPLRSSMEMSLPTEANIVLTIDRGGALFQLTLPWIYQDYYDFSEKQVSAEAKKKKKTDTNPPDDAKTAEFASHEFFVGFSFLSKALESLPKSDQGMSQALYQFLMKHSFQVFWMSPSLKLATTTGTDERPMEDRKLPDGAIPIANETFPAYLIPKDGGLVGYVRVATFSLDESADIKRFGKILKVFNTFKVKGVILDLLDNGGGSLIAGLRLANQMTAQPLKYPGLQLALNDNWLDSFQSQALSAKTDMEKTWAARIEKILREDKTAGKRLSRTVDTRELDPVVTNQPKAGCVEADEDKACLASGIKVVTLVNEMCASMCDIFAGVLRDNQIGTLMGVKTMGAGGNVVMHVASPVSFIMLQQTESLMVDSQGEYLENQGVVPAITYDTIMDRKNNYEGAIAKALKSF